MAKERGFPISASNLASSIKIEAMKTTPLPVPKGMRQKARATKPTKDLSQLTFDETLPSGPNLPLPKSPHSLPSKMVGSLSIATSGVVATPTEQPAQASSPIATPSSPPKNLKPSSSKSKKKGKVVASPPRYSPENAYSNYFFEFKKEHLFEKYIIPRIYS